MESRNKKKVPFKERLKFRMSGVDSMEKFVKKRLINEYPFPLLLLVFIGIKVVKFSRIVRTLIFG